MLKNLEVMTDKELREKLDSAREAYTLYGGNLPIDTKSLNLLTKEELIREIKELYKVLGRDK